jgi:hypothetical protein
VIVVTLSYLATSQTAKLGPETASLPSLPWSLMPVWLGDQSPARE